MIKVIDPAGFNFDQPITSMVELHRRGIDASWLRKTAAVLTKELSEIRPEPGKTYMHVIALGDMESHGSNRNGDGFPKSANEKYHDTFVKHANFYKHHKNKPYLGHTIYGQVKYSAYNPEMHRVELIVAIDNEKAPDTVEKVASGKDIPLSMAASVPSDFCSICGHEAKSTKAYCDCLKKYATQLLSDGRQVCMINKEPKFFDISEVVKNADRIAFSLRKVAAAGQCTVHFSADQAQEMNVTAPDPIEARQFDKFHRLLKEAAAVERQLMRSWQSDASMQTIADALNAPLLPLFKQACDRYLPGLLNGLKEKKASLPLPDFFRMVMGPKYAEVEELIPEAQAALPGIYSEIEKNPVELFTKINRYLPLDKPAPYDIMNVVREAGNKGSLFSGPVQGRITTVSLRKQSSRTTRMLPVNHDPRGRLLAREYALYKLAFMMDESPFVVKMSILQNLGGLQ